MAVKQDKIWEFDVTDPQMHPKGFTVYRVVCKVFSVNTPESLTELILWKRYNDFKQLYKTMSTLQKALHRKDPFPYFAKPKVFGRFDDAVIEERRKSAADLLNFIGQQPHLYRAQAFQAFLKSGCIDQREKTRSVESGVLRPSKIDLLDTRHQGDGYPPPDIVPAAAADSPSTDMEHPAADNSTGTDSVLSASTVDEVSSQTLEGTWKFPQVPDNISLGSSTEAEDTEDTDVDSTLGTPLPDADLSFFDPLTSTQASSSQGESASQTMKWLEDALHTCASMEEKERDVTSSGDADGGSREPGLLQSTELGDLDGTTCGMAIDSAGGAEVSDSGPCSLGTSDQTFDISEFDPLRERSASKVECGKGDMDFEISGSHSITSRGASFSSLSSSSGPTTPKSRTATPKSMSPLNRPARSGTASSVSTMDLGGKEDYIYIAARQICLAQDCEANGSYEQAFNCYKTGVGILLQGVQGDNNRARRDAVRKKTAQYLMKAEALYNRYLSSDSTVLDERRWAADTLISPCLELDPSFALIKGSVMDMRSFKVLGTVGKVLLVMDRQTDETYVIKTIYKSSTAVESKPSLMPTSIPHMVNLYRFFETDNAIYLLLQYASGGKLWDYISGYLHQGKGNAALNSQIGEEVPDPHNIYTGHKLHDSLSPKFSPNHSASTDYDGEAAGTKEAPLADISIPPADRVVRFSRHSQLSDVSPMNEGQVDIGLSATDTSVAQGEDGHLASVGTEGDEAVDVVSTVENSGPCASKYGDDSQAAQSDQPPSNRAKIDYNRFSSISSEDYQVQDSETLPASCSQPLALPSDEAGEPFEELLKSSQPPLENFSINSFESDGHASDTPLLRLSSKNSDLIERIPEDVELSAPDSELSPPTPQFESSEGKVGDEVFSGMENGAEVNDELIPAQVLPDGIQGADGNEVSSGTAASSEMNAEEILRSSRELLQSVDRVLSESDSLEPLEASEIEISSTDVSSAPKADQDSSEEPSIYDLHRVSDDSDSTGVHSPSPLTSVPDQPDMANDSMHTSGDTVIASPQEVEDNEVKFKSIPPPLTDLGTTKALTSTEDSNMNSSRVRHLSDMTRSASFECDLKSPVKNKARALSSYFEQLDAESPEIQRIPESCIKCWAAEIVVALAALHAQGIVCRDLKPDNLLLGERGHLILTYFCQLRQADHEIDWTAVEQLYTAPEVRSIGGCNEACDWWSLGALLYELLVGRTLYQCHPGGINSHTQLHFPTSISTEAQALLQELLCYNPRERLGAGLDGAEEIKSHPFFLGTDWHAVETS